MPSKIYSAALVGLDAFPIEVEVDLSRGLHHFSIVGLPDKSVEEAKERVSSAIKNSDLEPPNRTNRRVTVNLAPADIKKEGPKYDLPIALSYLVSSGQVYVDSKNKIFVGELALDGSVRSVSGILPIALMARDRGFKELYVPTENRREAALVEGILVFGVSSLSELVLHLSSGQARSEITTLKQIISPEPSRHGEFTNKLVEHDHDFSHIKGQEYAKRALEIAASGGHNILMGGPPGSGKTLLARALVSILPEMRWEEFLEVTKIFSAAGLTTLSPTLSLTRPFRNPHHSASAPALVGGGSNPRPGEITLSHRGVLFLDEFPEFDRHVLESLRQPLEDGVVTVSRAQGSLTFPAKFMLVATMNPCPCGFLNDQTRSCICTPYQVSKYRRKLSGPLLDRIDLHVNVPRVEYEKLSQDDQTESSSQIRERVSIAREIQATRFASYNYKTNSEMRLKHIREFCALDEDAEKIIKAAMVRYDLSARAYHRILKLARTIADLSGKQNILSDHVSEALQFRFQKEEI